MKTITINVSEPVYADFQKYAREKDRPTSELIREAMEAYRETRIRPRPSVLDGAPASVGKVRRTWRSRGDLTGDLFDRSDDRD